MSLERLILGGIGVALIAKHFSESEDNGRPVPHNLPDFEGIDMQATEAAVGKIYDSYGERKGGRVDQHWGFPKPDKSYLGRTAEMNAYYLDPGKAIERFDLHGIEFGNWMNQEDRLNFMYATLVSLADMAKVMNVSQEKMGLNQKLQLAFGAWGKGGYVAAFYARTPVALINLTKTMGKGAFSHEYGHAIDEHVRLKLKGQSGLLTGRTTNRQTNPGLYPKDSIEYLFEMVFHTLYWKPDGKPTAFYDAQSGRTDYYNRRSEVWARTFERYIEIKFKEKGIVNHWAISPDSTQPPHDLVRKAAPWIQKIIRQAF